MQPANLAAAADELYALPPGEFRAARDERAAQARAAGDRELAAAIRKLRRPTVSAWLANQLARAAGDQVAELLHLGAALREAQSALAGDRLRELSERRRQLVPALTRTAAELAAHARQPVSDQAERELTGTLEAALADPAAGDAVRSGRLATALSYAGLGGPDAAAAVDIPDTGEPPAAAGRKAAARERGGPASGRAADEASQRGRQRQPAGQAAADTAARRRAGPDAGNSTAREAAGREAAAREARAARETEAARRNLAEAEAVARDAADDLAGAEQQAATAAGQHQAALQRVEDRERELREAQSAEARTARAAGEARRSRDTAARTLATAQRRLARARERAGQGD